MLPIGALSAAPYARRPSPSRGLTEFLCPGLLATPGVRGLRFRFRRQTELAPKPVQEFGGSVRAERRDVRFGASPQRSPYCAGCAADGLEPDRKNIEERHEHRVGAQGRQRDRTNEPDRARMRLQLLGAPGEHFHRVGDLLDGAGGPPQGNSCSDLFGGHT